jgi:CMP-N-acetylneuraminic acid synthetase
MYKGKKVTAIILARKGSKRIPNKNIKIFAGKPLIEWTLIDIQDSKYIDEVLVSSDSQETLEIASKFKKSIQILRPKELSSDTATSIDGVLHATQGRKNGECLMLLQITSPIKTGQDLDQAIVNFIDSEAKTLVSVVKMKENPFHAYYEKEGFLSPVARKVEFGKRSQDLPISYQLNGAIFIAQTKFFMENKSFVSPAMLKYEMPYKCSYDIDEPEHFYQAEVVFKKIKELK